MNVPLPSLVFFQGERFPGALSVIKSRAPVTGGNFGVWGGMFSTFDCAIKGWRQKEDAWNAIASGFLTGGCLAARSKSLLPLGPLGGYGLLTPFEPQVARSLLLVQQWPAAFSWVCSKALAFWFPGS